MSNYERFDSSDSATVAQLDVTGSSKDVKVDVDKGTSAENGGSLTIYRTDHAASEYIEDPGAKDPVAGGAGSIRGQVKKIVEHLVFRALTVILIILDFTLVTIDLAVNKCGGGDALEVISHIIISYFMLELAARLFYLQREFFRSYLDIGDGAIVVLSFIVDMVFVGISSENSCKGTNHANYARLLVIGRVFRIIRIGRIIYLMIMQRRHVATATRHVVSQNKRRYQKDGFDLDLCYITERVIAMSFPSKGLMSMYRNDINEVARFFNTKHKDHYKIYNLCSERDYDETKFNNMVERIFIDDHNVPRLREMVSFSENVREWMAKDERNVISVHCKGGKGRTGTMICTWLVDCGLFEEAEDSLEYFGDRRTDLTVGKKFQGVETPSQSRYVGYYERVKKDLNGELPPPKPKIITSIKLMGLAGVGNGDGTDLSMEIRADGLLIYECKFQQNINCELQKYDPNSDSVVVNLKNCPKLIDDIKVRFFSTSRSIPQVYDHCAFFFWFHTYFIEDNLLKLPREEIDNPHKKQAQKVFKENFALEVSFADVEE
ncbi:hypothetical protein FSP39_001190 [Pinctada imbricata]|uniref:Phosphatidylinositol-3,4,5-trisphosphate 3-phosphatase n=1 Tax=Pinctada imbricata TaxID=66713 RepID=A0AA88Y6N7_PINIB|nr:hypothetical protein FSP39_001190 [Pinctada imbricata]